MLDRNSRVRACIATSSFARTASEFAAVKCSASRAFKLRFSQISDLNSNKSVETQMHKLRNSRSLLGHGALTPHSTVQLSAIDVAAAPNTKQRTLGDWEGQCRSSRAPGRRVTAILEGCCQRFKRIARLRDEGSLLSPFWLGGASVLLFRSGVRERAPLRISLLLASPLATSLRESCHPACSRAGNQAILAMMVVDLTAAAAHSSSVLPAIVRERSRDCPIARLAAPLVACRSTQQLAACRSTLDACRSPR